MMTKSRLGTLSLSETKVRGEGEQKVDEKKGHEAEGNQAKAVMEVLLSDEL